MKLSYGYDIDERKLFVFDEFLPAKDRRAFAASLEGTGFHRLEQDTEAAENTASFSRDYEVRAIEVKPFVRRIRALVKEYYPALRAPAVYRAYANLGLYGDMHVPHRDSEGAISVTALYYANDVWDWTWAGETIFFNEKNDSIATVSPKPGRLALFDGAIQHRTGSVARTCRVSRFTVAIKFEAGKGD
jgi:Rps23 Pro-64 3,4-dihydroxylase Tpa1-like proline 4-hydroxylase